MSVLRGIGLATVGIYAASVLCIGRKKTNAYFRAVPDVVRCIPDLMVRHVEKRGPYPAAKNVFTGRTSKPS